MKEDLPLKIAGVLVELFQKNNKSKQINCGRVWNVVDTPP